MDCWLWSKWNWQMVDATSPDSFSQTRLQSGASRGCRGRWDSGRQHDEQLVSGPLQLLSLSSLEIN